MVKDLTKLTKFINTNKDKDEYAKLGENDIKAWNTEFTKYNIQKKQEAQQKQNKNRGREALKTSKDFEDTAAVIATANFQYARELFLDSYMCGPASLLSSMSFEASLKTNKNTVQHDSWINIHQMLALVCKKMALQRQFNALMIDKIDIVKHWIALSVLGKPVQRSLVKKYI